MGDVIEGSTIRRYRSMAVPISICLALQPGVSPYSGDDTAAGFVQAPISGSLNNGTQSINGGRPEANGFMVNGADAEEGVHNGAAIVPNLDSIAEFRIITNNFNAEYGNYSGGQINVVTKSGSNQFHGDLFDFLRNTDLDARNYFSPTRGVFIQNQFGGVFGGPIQEEQAFLLCRLSGNQADSGGHAILSGSVHGGSFRQLVGRGSSFSSGTDAASNPIATTFTAANWATILGSRLGYTVINGEPYSTPLEW